MRYPRIVVLGGGTGSFTLLQSLKVLTPHITAIVNMSDDGGSTGALRDELGVLPPGDIRQCLVALSDSVAVRNLFSYRFSDGRFAGQSLGNIILSGLELQYGSFQEAVKVAGDILHIRGSVVPVTLDKHTLVVQDGSRSHRGEHVIDGALPLSIQAVIRLEPAANLNPQAKQAIKQADLVILAPGSVYSSLVPILAVQGMSQALTASKATLICVTNLVNKPLQTEGWHVVDYVKQFERYIGGGRIDMVLYNTEPISPALLARYAEAGEYPVATTKSRFKEVSAKAHGARLVAKEVSAYQASDTVRRTLIRHDAAVICAEVEKLLSKTQRFKEAS